MAIEIKFRAFDGVDYVTKPFTLIDLQNGMIQLASTDTVVMQYTGLKDKNGKEIYEGDVLQYPNEKMKPVVRFGEYSLGDYDTYEEGCGFYLEIDGKQYHSLTTGQCSRLHIIGNIYENPELLNQ